jgi:hypothetical protein
MVKLISKSFKDRLTRNAECFGKAQPLFRMILSAALFLNQIFKQCLAGYDLASTPGPPAMTSRRSLCSLPRCATMSPSVTRKLPEVQYVSSGASLFAPNIDSVVANRGTRAGPCLCPIKQACPASNRAFGSRGRRIYVEGVRGERHHCKEAGICRKWSGCELFRR